MAMTYTAPERNTERRLAGIIRAKIMKNPCAHCLNRVEGWDHAACMACRTYPACTEALTGPHFEPDPKTIPELEKAA
jgi:hypothetical protein